MELTITQQGNVFTLDGVINEFAKFEILYEFSGAEMVLNLKKVNRINSTGVREWINAIEKIDNKITIIFEECPPVVVYQMTMIPNFTARAKVRSVYAPYYCPECGHQEDFLININELDLSKGLTEQKCPSCGSKMEFDDDEESYFYFMEISK